MLPADCEVIDIGGGSYIEHYKGLLPASIRRFQKAWKHIDEAENNVFGATSSTKRVQAFYSETEDIVGYKFASQISKRVDKMSTFPGYKKFKDKTLDLGFNGLLVNYYGPKSTISKHSDDMTHLVEKSEIMTISWYDMSMVPKELYKSRCTKSGAPYRRFRLIPKENVDIEEEASLKTNTIELFNGDIVIMRGNCQTTHNHEIMPSRKLPKKLTDNDKPDLNAVPNLCEQNNRISLTFRKHESRA